MVAVLMVLLYMVFIDVAINVVFRYPRDPQNINPSFLEGYFEYGRSVEGKLEIMTRKNLEESAPRVKGGWLNSNRNINLPTRKSEEDQVLVALYGMSHTQELWKAMQKLDDRILVRGFMSAGATPNWAYAAYEHDKGRHEADVVILGIMTEGVSLVTSTTGMTAYFDNSYPYTFPRYSVEGNELAVALPPFVSAEGYVRYFYDVKKWNKYRKWLAENDKWYDPVLFNRSLSDNSAFMRLLRRAYSEKQKQERVGRVSNEAGFNEKSEEVIILKTLVKNFASSARKKDIIPVIYIVNLQSQGLKLFKILKPALDADKIPYLSTHIICPPDDPRVFLIENSHFTPTKDQELAKEMIAIINEAIKQKKEQ